MASDNADFGDTDPALRAMMNASVSDIRIPADMLERAIRGNRRRRKARARLAAVAGAAASMARAGKPGRRLSTRRRGRSCLGSAVMFRAHRQGAGLITTGGAGGRDDSRC